MTLGRNKSFLIFFIVGFFGFLLAVYPEIAIVLLVFAGVVAFCIAFSSLRSTIPLFLFFLIVRFRIELSLFAFLECILQVLFVCGVILARRLATYSHKKSLFFGLSFGLVFLVISVLGLKKSTWNDTEGVAKFYFYNDKIKVAPIGLNAYIVHSLDFQGSGEIEYSFEIKADKKTEMNMEISHQSLKNGFTKVKCSITENWTLCRKNVVLTTRSKMFFLIGGYGTWKSGDSPIEMRNNRVNIVIQPTLLEKLTVFSRTMGSSFNFNSFGAQIVVFGLLALIIAPTYSWVTLVVTPTLILIFLSGSRGALTAFAIGLLVLILARSRVYKFLPLVLALTFTGIVIFQVSTIRGLTTSVVAESQTGLRSLNIADEGSTRGRLEIWRLATKAWLESPQTFLFGTGDLTKAMRAKVDVRSSSFGLTKDSLTHAHNLWIQTAGESGLLGLCAMMWLWGWVILRAWRSRDADALALLAAIFVINSVDYLFFYAPVHLAFWMAAAGLKPPEPTPVPPEGSAILAS